MEQPFAPLELFRHLSPLRREMCAIGYLADDGRLLAMRHFPLADRDATRLSIRAVAADAFAFDAGRVVMAHNHPSGDPRPSTADIEVTRALARALDALSVALSDHLVVAPDGDFSFRAAGLL